MPEKALYLSATGCTGVMSVDFHDGYGQATSYAEIVCTGTTLDINDNCTIDAGWADDHDILINDGLVKDIRANTPEFTYTIVVHDVLVKATDYFMAADDPDSPFTATNIKAEDLVVNLLSLVGLTSVVTEPTIFTYGTEKPIPINLVGLWEELDNICRICGFTMYADGSGTIHFVDRKPYIIGSDSPYHTFVGGDGGDIIKMESSRSDKNLRNRVVVYGDVLSNGRIKSVASASSPYLPADYYKSMVISHPLIQSQHDADRTADINLTMFNRLTQTANLEALGLSSCRARTIVAVDESFTLPSDTGAWFVFSTQHTIGKDGYSMNLTLVR